MVLYTGGCLCGAVRYEAINAPVSSGLCYCEDCRKASCSGFMPYMVFSRAALNINGETGEVKTKAANGNISSRHYCLKCGSTVYGGDLTKAEVIPIYAGSLDDPSEFEPTEAVFTEGRPDWALIPKGLKVYDCGYS